MPDETTTIRPFVWITRLLVPLTIRTIDLSYHGPFGTLMFGFLRNFFVYENSFAQQCAERRRLLYLTFVKLHQGRITTL